MKSVSPTCGGAGVRPRALRAPALNTKKKGREKFARARDVVPRAGRQGLVFFGVAPSASPEPPTTHAFALTDYGASSRSPRRVPSHLRFAHRAARGRPALAASGSGERNLGLVALLLNPREYTQRRPH